MSDRSDESKLEWKFNINKYRWGKSAAARSTSRYNAPLVYNDLPIQMRQQFNIGRFKKDIRIWINDRTHNPKLKKNLIIKDDEDISHLKYIDNIHV